MPVYLHACQWLILAILDTRLAFARIRFTNWHTWRIVASGNLGEGFMRAEIVAAPKMRNVQYSWQLD